MAVASFGLATNRVWVTKQGERKEDAQFHRIVAWNKLAELCSQLLAKGRRIYVEGRIQYREIVDQENNRKQVSEIVIDDMIILDNKGAGAGATQDHHQPAAAEEYGASDNGTIEDIVIPDEVVEGQTAEKTEETPVQQPPQGGEEMPF